MKTCSRCGEKKELGQFHLRGDGHRSMCKLCMKERTKSYEKTKDGFLMRAYRNMLSRVSGVQSKKAGIYLGMDIMSKDEFKLWCSEDESFKKLFLEWEESDYSRKLTPSVDRIYTDFGYMRGNVRWLTHSENSSRANSGYDTTKERVWFTSDLHLGHKNILSFQRGGDFECIEEMHEVFVGAWNRSVGENDLVYVLGDILMGNKQEAMDVLSQLNGFIVCIKANHDSEKIFDQLNTISQKQLYTMEQLKTVRINKKTVVMCHYPMYSWERSERGSYHVFGHCHDSINGVGKSLDVGVDAAKRLLGEYRPFSFEEVSTILDQKEIADTRFRVAKKYGV